MNKIFCDNKINIFNMNKDAISRIKISIESDSLFNNWIPRPVDEKNWLKWNLENWGTTKDIIDGQISHVVSPYELECVFTTMTAPPIAAYEHLTKNGFTIQAFFHIPDLTMCGTWNKVTNEESFEYNFENEDWRQDIPPYLIEDLCLEELYQDWLEYKTI
jgi:hypothetical protein